MKKDPLTMDEDLVATNISRQGLPTGPQLRGAKGEALLAAILPPLKFSKFF